MAPKLLLPTECLWLWVINWADGIYLVQIWSPVQSLVLDSYGFDRAVEYKTELMKRSHYFQTVCLCSVCCVSVSLFQCIEEWLWTKQACPTCRKHVVMPEPLYWTSTRVKVPWPIPATYSVVVYFYLSDIAGIWKRRLEMCLQRSWEFSFSLCAADGSSCVINLGKHGYATVLDPVEMSTSCSYM